MGKIFYWCFINWANQVEVWNILEDASLDGAQFGIFLKEKMEKDNERLNFLNIVEKRCNSLNVFG